MNNQIISQTYSNKIKVLSVIAIIMVLFIHVQMKEGASMPVVEYVQRVFGFCGMSFIANPFFSHLQAIMPKNITMAIMMPNTRMANMVSLSSLIMLQS